MTIKVVVAVSDRALGEYMNPFLVPSIGVAMRAFQDEVNKQDSVIGAHPEDYELHRLCDFDTESGEMVGAERKVLARAKDVLLKE